MPVKKCVPFWKNASQKTSEQESDCSSGKSILEIQKMKHPQRNSKINLDQIWKDTQPKDPSEQSWDRVWDNIEKKIDESTHPEPARRKAPWLVGAALIAASLALLLSRNVNTRPAVDQISLVEKNLSFDKKNENSLEGELVIVTSSEIEINSMDEDDTDSLIVGRPPVVGPLEMVSHQEFKLDHMETHPEGQTMDLVQPEQGPPMIVTRSQR